MLTADPRYLFGSWASCMQSDSTIWSFRPRFLFYCWKAVQGRKSILASCSLKPTWMIAHCLSHVYDYTQIALSRKSRWYERARTYQAVENLQRNNDSLISPQVTTLAAKMNNLLVSRGQPVCAGRRYDVHRYILLIDDTGLQSSA